MNWSLENFREGQWAEYECSECHMSTVVTAGADSRCPQPQFCKHCDILNSLTTIPTQIIGAQK